MRRTTLVAMVIMGFSLAMAADIESAHRTRTYRVSVESSFGTTFTDCFRFNTPNSGDLSADLLGQTLTYRHGKLDTVRRRFKAVTRDNAFEIMYFGRFITPDDQIPPRITGEAINELGDTFVFSGVRDEACTSSSETLLPNGSGMNPYSG